MLHLIVDFLYWFDFNTTKLNLQCSKSRVGSNGYCFHSPLLFSVTWTWCCLVRNMCDSRSTTCLYIPGLRFLWAIVTLKPGKHIFLKGYDVTRCRDFDHLLSASQQCDIHFFKNLPHEQIVIESPVRSSYLMPKGPNQDPNQLGLWSKPKIT